ncbi:MAG: HD domain-containing phosphohydrolase [Terriglobales bacterium]
MPEKILLVDDEPAVLQGLQRLLHGIFDTETAVGGTGALILLENNGPYAVVVSDMRMPQMNGVELLAKIKSRAPDTVRVMLTGNADIQTAVKAVNEGNIFRFLTKPCEKELLATTLTAALLQHRLLVAEKQLLEQTLSGSVQVLTEVLSLVSPAAFSRAARARRYMHHIVTRVALGNHWKFEVAAMMSQLGCVAIDPEIIEGVYSGRQLSAAEQARYDTHPTIAHDLLSKIPRMEPIAWIIAHQNRPTTVEGDISDPERADMRLGADLLQVVLAFDALLHQGMSRTEAAHRLSRQGKRLDPRIFEALVELEPEAADKQVHTLPITELSPGMIIEQEIRNQTGSLLVASGQEVTLPLLLKLESLHEARAIEGSVRVSSPRGERALRKAFESGR